MNRSDLPLFLSVTDVAKVIGVGKNRAYDLIHMPDFPTIRLGHRIVIPRDQLFLWIDHQVANKLGHS